jgi:hypothetical protein
MEDNVFYESLRPLAEQRLSELREADEEELARLEIESVDVADDPDVGTHVVVLFRDPARPECRFGWRWSWKEGPKPDEVEFAAGVLATNLEEDILSETYGLPKTCADDGVTWF